MASDKPIGKQFKEDGNSKPLKEDDSSQPILSKYKKPSASVAKDVEKEELER